MPRTIDEGFRDFHTRLTPSSVESAASKSHRASIEACLKNNFGLKRFARIGSYGNGTSISGYSDVDYLASLPRNQLTNSSSYSLKKIRDSLDRRFPNTGVRVDCPAIAIPFGRHKSDTTEIVPADYLKEESGFKVYDISDCSNGWTRASPDAHNAYVRYVDSKLSGKVKPLIRFIKAWKYLRRVPISSFYLELRVARFADTQQTIIYEFDVKSVLCQLRDCELARMQDPMGISGYISACKSSAMREDALSKLDRAARRAENARAAASKGKTVDAFFWWRLLYNNEFPSYYY